MFLVAASQMDLEPHKDTGWTSCSNRGILLPGVNCRNRRFQSVSRKQIEPRQNVRRDEHKQANARESLGWARISEPPANCGP